ncbi:MAG TPA: serine/threonine-protein kinase [Polyangiaceae bacterium]
MELRPGGSLISPRGRVYLLGERLGDGSFGDVFDAVGPFDQRCAVKVFRPRLHQAAVREQWLKEASRLYQLRHPHIVYVYDYFEVAGLFFLVMERCDHTLEVMLSAPFTDRLVIEIMRQLLFAAQYLSDNEVLHNDIHAGNVLVVQGQNLIAKLSDLGIAQDLSGRPSVRPEMVQHRIMAPELVRGGYSTKQSDLYQLGLLMYHMHTAESAIDTSGGYDAMIEQIHEGVPRARAEALRTPLGEIIAVMLRRHEQYRFASPAQVWEELRRLQSWTEEHEPEVLSRNTAPLPPVATDDPDAAPDTIRDINRGDRRTIPVPPPLGPGGTKLQ